jgi:Bacteriophage T4-like portal protein (Gp20)
MDLDGVKTTALHQTPWYSALFRRFGLWSHPQGPHDFDSFMDDTVKNDGWWDSALTPAANRLERYRITDDMDNGLVAAILDVWAEETTQTDYLMKRAVWITAKDQQVARLAEAALASALIEDRICSMARVVAKRGDDFWRHVYKAGVGLQGIQRVPAAEVERIEDPHSRLIGFKQKETKFRGDIKRDTSFPWDFTHFRMLGGKGENTSYGTGICDTMFLAEDSVLAYRIRRTPDRNMVLVDVNGLSEDEAVDYLNLYRKSFRKQEFIDPGCITLDTKIRTLVGDMTLAQVIDAFARKEQVWVYGYDEKSRTVVPSPVSWAGVTRKDAELVEVEIDDGFVLRCTPDHRIAVMNGSQPKRGPKVKGAATSVKWVEAKDLKVGDQLVPLRKGSHLKGGRRRYETILDPFGGWGFLHTRVVEADVSLSSKWAACKQPQCHHLDENVTNNHPSNLQVMEAIEHTRLHSNQRSKSVTLVCHVCRNVFKRVASKVRDIRSKLPLCSKVCWSVAGKKHDPRTSAKMLALYRKSKEQGNVELTCTGCSVVFLRCNSEAKLPTTRGKFCSLSCYSRTRLDARKRECEYCGNEFYARAGKYLTQKFCSPNCGFAHRTKRNAGLVPVPNHTVVSVKQVVQRCDTGDLTVEATSNFFVADNSNVGGILIHNSSNYRKAYNPLAPLDDIFVPIRGQNNSTRIESLSGSAAQDSLADLDHFRRSFFGSGRVPQAFLGFAGDLNGRATLANQDVRFARGAKRLQRSLIYGVRNMTDLHLALGPQKLAADGLSTNYDPNNAETQYLVNMAPVNALEEFEHGELIKLRVEIMTTYAALGETLTLDMSALASYLLLNFAKLPEAQVKKMIAKPLAGAKETQPESIGSYGFGSVTPAEQKLLNEAVQLNPRLRVIFANLFEARNDLPSAAYTFEEQVYLQTDKSTCFPYNQIVESDDLFSTEMRELMEDVNKLKKGKN